MAEQLALIGVDGVAHTDAAGAHPPDPVPRAEPVLPGAGAPAGRAGRHYRLVRHPVAPAAPPALDDAQRAVTEHTAGPLLVLAGPGTGKTTTLVEAVVARIHDGADPESVLVLTFGRKAANELRERITARLGRTTAEPLARTFHSYAFGLLRRVAAERGEPAPRLLSGPEQDLLIRELLIGDAERFDDPASPGVLWPERLRPALRTDGFAAELRDLLLRAYERGVDAVQLDAWGRRHGRDDWRAAARFMQQYADVTELRDASTSGGVAFDTAELIRAAVTRLRRDPGLLAAERTARAYVFVDEYQDTDPAQAELLHLLCGGGRFLVAVGDPDQSIYAFRGADAEGIRRFGDTFLTAGRQPAPTVALTTCRRSGATLLAASRRAATRLRGPVGHRALHPAPGLAAGDVEAAVLRSGTQEAAYVAHRLREAHLLDGLPWSRMAVVVRSTARHLASLRRALTYAGVPIGTAGEDLPLLDQPGVVPLLDVVRYALHPDALDEDAAVALLCSPLGDADALVLRRLRQQLRLVAEAAGDPRPSGILLVEALRDPSDLVPLDERWGAPARRVAGLLAVARQAAASPGATAETLLWAAWDASGLAGRWQAASAEGGARGAAADRDLDAAVALFDAAARFADRLPAAGPQMFLDHVLGQQIPADSLAPAAETGELVRILTAHAAKGLEWDVVAVAGVQEGVWPDLRPRGSLLGSEELVDLAASREPDRRGQLSALLDEERRLFYVAVTRARRRLLVTAVEGEDEQPSRFLDEIDPRPSGASEPRPLTDVPRTLSLAGLVAELRGVVLAPPADPATREAVTDPATGGAAAEAASRRVAAAQLARLAAAGVPGAAPADWWGLHALSDARPLREPGDPVRVSPSKVEQFHRCALRWVLESAGGESTSSAQAIGNLVHDIAAESAETFDLATLNARLAARWSSVDVGGGWFAEKERARAERMVAKLAGWLAGNPRRLVAVEEAFRVEVGRAVVRGRIDRLEADDAGRLVVVDLKTGKSAPKDGEVAAHPQLGVYQLAVERGGFAEHGTEPGGAALVQVGTPAKDVKEQRQPPLGQAGEPGWAERLVVEAAEGMAGSAFEAVRNDLCRVCPVSTSCPVRSRQVTT